jgi:uncharacterized protein YfeS
MKKFYYDDPEVGLDPATCHPHFNELMQEDFYFDCVDELAPFGNDDGAATLSKLEDWYRKRKGKADIVEFMFNLIDGFGFKYACDGCVQLLDMDEINQLMDEDEFFIDCMDQAVIATVLGQLKIEGKIDPRLKELGFITIERQKLITQQYNTSNLPNSWLERLEVMKTDLEKVK